MLMDIITLLLAAGALGVSLLCLRRLEEIRRGLPASSDADHSLRDFLSSEMREIRSELREQFAATQTAEERSRNAYQETQDARLRGIVSAQNALSQDMHRALGDQERRLDSFASSQEEKSERLRALTEEKLESIRKENRDSLEAMRRTVDEKMQETLENNITRSFRTVSERLELVNRGLGEVQGLARGVGDLSKILTNVKTKGILGEMQLEAILEELLSPEQYEREVITRPGRSEHVEFALRLPQPEGETVLLPIDAKFPAEPYRLLCEAREKGDPAEIQGAQRLLITRLRASAKEITDKYVEVPYTTDFAIMFLPFEGLYAEAAAGNLLEDLQREYRICVAGPSTMAAMLSALRIGLRSVAVQKRSHEVWNVLQEVRTEFDKFGEVLDATEQRLSQAQGELDKLVGVRTRSIRRKLEMLEK